MNTSRFLRLFLFAVLVWNTDALVQTSDKKNAPPRPEKWAVKLESTNLFNCYRITTNLYRGAQPSAKGMAELKSMGVRTVLNLRGFHSDQNVATGTGLKLSRLHMEPWHAENADVVEFLKLVANTNNLPLYIHCQRGADRTGMLCAMYRVVVCDWPRQDAIEEMMEGGFRFNPMWRNLVRYIERADIDELRRRAGLPPYEKEKLKPAE